jgi:hypothetical protein
MVATMRRSALLHWLTWASAMVVMICTFVGVMTIPAGQEPDGLVTVQQVFRYVGGRSYSLNGLSPLVWIYLPAGLGYLVTAVLLVGGMAGRARWSRFVAAVPAALALAVTALFAGIFLLQTQSYDSKEAITNRRTAGVAFLVLAMLVLAAFVFLLTGRRAVFDWYVVGYLVVVGICHTASLLLVQAFPPADELRLTVVAFLPTAGYLVTAGLAALSALARPRLDSPSASPGPGLSGNIPASPHPSFP